MSKSLCRKLKSHYLDRWAVYRHNLRCCDKILLLEDAMVIKELLPGRTLMLDCLGEMFADLVPDLDTQPHGLYENIVMINNTKFKYLDTQELYEVVQSVALKHLAPRGRLFCTCSHRYLIYDRTNHSIESAFSGWKEKNLKLFDIKIMLGKARQSFGDIWLYLQYE